MFAENERISGRQLYRMIVTSFAGPTLLVCPLIAGKFGGDGLYIYMVWGILTALYLWLVVKYIDNTEGKETNNKILKKAIYVLARIIVCLRLLLLAVGGLYLISDIVTGILLPETKILAILLLVVAGLIYWNRGSIESTGRGFEIIYYWVLIPVIIVIGLAAPKVSVANIVPKYDASCGKIIFYGVIMWLLFAPCEILAICRDHYVKNKKTNESIWRGFLVIFLGNVITFAVVLGIYGEKGINIGGTYPLLKVMQISGIPGDFLRRVDGLMGVFLVLSLFCGMVVLLDFLGISLWQACEVLFGKKENETNKMTPFKWIKSNKKIVFSVVVTSIMVISVYSIQMNLIDKKNDKMYEEAFMEKSVISGTELEDRAFVMSVIIGDETISFEIASDEEGQWRNKSSYVTLTAEHVWQAEKSYKENGDKKLDFSHLKLIFIEDEIYDKDITTNNLRYLYEKEKFAENVLVCPMAGDVKKMAADAMENKKALANSIEEILVNSGKSGELELYKVYLERVK